MSAEDHRLWEEVRRSVRPLGPARSREPGQTPIGDIGDAAGMSAEPAVPRTAYRKPPALPSWQPPAQPVPARKPGALDEKTIRKLKKGRLAIDARIDLHGMAEHQAHHALNRFIENARRDGSRIVLVITGKGERSGGILRRAVPRWLHEPLLAGMVGSWREAHPSHGGEGALYLRLRRSQDSRPVPEGGTR